MVGGVVGDAARYVEHGWVVGGQGVVGTGMDAAVALCAEIGVFGIIRIIGAFLGGDDFAEVDPGTPPLGDKEGVAADPAESGTGGPMLVADRYGVAATFALDTQPLSQGKKHLLDVLMIIAIFCVSSHLTSCFAEIHRPILFLDFWILPAGREIVWGRIGADETDDALGSGDEKSRVHTLLDIALHIVETAVPAACKPLVKGLFLVGEGVGAGDATVVEAHLEGNPFYFAGI